MKQLSKELLLLLCAVVSCGAAWAQGETVCWVKVTDYSNLSTSDTYVIAGNGISGDETKWFSLKNNQISSTGNLGGIPVGSELEISENKIISTITEDETWKLESSTTENAYYIKSTKGYYLQNTGSTVCLINGKNNSTNNNLWYIHHSISDYDNNYSAIGLYNLGQKRTLGMFHHTNWRCYGRSYTNYINGEEVVLYRKVVVVPVSISEANYASYCYNKTLDFSSTGITVYKAKGTETAVTLTKVEDGIVPANKGVVLYSADATIQNVPVTTLTGSTDWSDNELIGITERTKISVNGAEGKTNYILSKEDDVVGFYLAASGEGAYLAANRAYLSTSATQQLVPQYLGFEEEITGIQSLTPTLSQGEGDCYDLSGRRVAQPTKGMYIINGRKVYVK